MRRRLISILAIFLAIGLVGAGAFAYFSDSETSTGNTFTAATGDLTYNVDYTYTGAGTVNVGGAGAGNDSNGINSRVVFSNLAPGDSGSITWTLENVGTISETLDVKARRTNDLDGVDTEPELLVDPDGPGGVGELDDNMDRTNTYCLDSVPYSTWSGSGPMGYTTYTSLDKLPVTLPAGSVFTIKWEWSIPSGVGNIIQGDTFQMDLQMTLNQL